MLLLLRCWLLFPNVGEVVEILVQLVVHIRRESAEKLLGLFGYSLKTLIRHQEPLLVGNRQIDDHTSDILDIFLVLIRTNKLLDIFKDALADLYPEIWVVFDAGRDEMPSLLFVLLLAGRYALRDFITLLIVNLFQLFL